MGESNLIKLEQDLDRLIALGKRMLVSLANEFGKENKEIEKSFPKEDLPVFSYEYEGWYSESYQIIKQLLPNRINDFTILYRNDKRKDLSYLTYTMSDYMIGLQRKQGNVIVLSRSSAFSKYQAQLHILIAAKRRFSSTLFDIRQIVRADLFDNELDAAVELLKNGFLRGAGVVAGVILEKHLADICVAHELKLGKKNPTIADFNDLLKNNEVIDVPVWRFIQRLGDLRNLCGHNKEREPEKEEVDELVKGARKITKTLY